MRNDATNPRYTDPELNLSIERATIMLGEYFFAEASDTTKTWVDGTYEYTYSFPIENIYRVEFIPSSGPPSIADDWQESGSILHFNRDHTDGQTIRIWYERHPFPYPDDGAADSAIDNSQLTFISSVNLLDWPETGFLKIDSEVMEYTAIDRSTDTFTVTRAQLGTAAATHANESVISFVNNVGKQVFYNGIRDISIMYLNRMRIIDAPSADIAGNVTVMREIAENVNGWIRAHRMRSSRPITQQTQRAIPFKTRRRGSRGSRGS